MPRSAPGRYAECLECSQLSRLSDNATEGECQVCAESGEDGWCTSVIDVTPCPNGPNCADENHDFGTGMHHAEVDQ